MTNYTDDILDALGAYREKYRRQNLDVPEHEIVIRPDQYAELMDSQSTRRFIDLSVPERNFAGVPIVLRDVGPHPIVRDRTMDIQR